MLAPKTHTAAHVIDVDDTVINELILHKSFQKKMIMKHRDIYHDQGFIFTSIDNELPGYPLYIKKVGNRMTRLLKLAELDYELTPHSL